MSRWKIAFSSAAVLSLATAALVPSAAFAEAPSADKISVISLSDTHVLEHSLIADTPEYAKVLDSDRKLITESEAIYNAAVNRVIKEKPNVVLISGDLTKDGEQESHKVVAAGLAKIKQALPGSEVYVINGNHDINNKHGVSFSNKTATPTTAKDFQEIYKDIYNDDSVIERFESPGSAPGPDVAGELSYVARPAPGYTIIAVDSGKYLPENEVSGAIDKKLQTWITQQAKTAKDRGDVVIAFGHHGWVPHFSAQPKVLPMYLIDNYKSVATNLANAGINYVFTGHAHTNDVSEMTTKAGNRLVDIETGSLLTYPNPMRQVDITRSTTDGSKVESTLTGKVFMEDTGLTNISFTDVKGKTQTIPNLTEYAKNSPQNRISKELVSTFAISFLNKHAAGIKAAGGLEQYLNIVKPMNMSGTDLKTMAFALLKGQLEKVDTSTLLDGQLKFIDLHSEAAEYIVDGLIKGIDRATANGKIDADTEKAITNFINKVMTTKLALDENNYEKTVEDFATAVYQLNLRGDENEKVAEMPAWFKEVKDNAQNSTVIKKIVKTAIDGDNLYPVIQALGKNIQMNELTNIKAYDTTNKQTLPYREGTQPLITFKEAPGKVNLAGFPINLSKLLPKLVNDNGWVYQTLTGTLDKLPYAVMGIDMPNMTGNILSGILNKALMGDPKAKNEQGQPAPTPSLFDEGQMGFLLTSKLRDVINSMSSDEDNVPDSNISYKTEHKLPESEVTLSAPVKAENGSVTITAEVKANAGVAGAANDNRTAIGTVQFYIEQAASNAPAALQSRAAANAPAALQSGTALGAPVALENGKAQLQLTKEEAEANSEAKVTARYLSTSIMDAISSSAVSQPVTLPKAEKKDPEPEPNPNPNPDPNPNPNPDPNPNPNPNPNPDPNPNPNPDPNPNPQPDPNPNPQPQPQPQPQPNPDNQSGSQADTQNNQAGAQGDKMQPGTSNNAKSGLAKTGAALTGLLSLGLLTAGLGTGITRYQRKRENAE